MSKSRTLFLKFESLSRQGEEGLLVIRLMMAFNDLALTNECLDIFKKRYDQDKSNKNHGASMYFIRIQHSHLNEAMKIVKEIKDNEQLLIIKDNCSDKAQKAFVNLLDYLPTGSKHKKFERYVGRIRNNITFHYDENNKLIKKYVEKRAKHSKGNSTSITKGDSGSEWRFKAADDVVSSIICRDIWEIPYTEDIKEAEYNALGFSYEIFTYFMDFAGEFIYEYCRKYAV